MMKEGLVLDFKRCELINIKFFDTQSIELMIYAHPYFRLYSSDNEIFKQYEDYKDAYVTFQICYN